MTQSNEDPIRRLEAVTDEMRHLPGDDWERMTGLMAQRGELVRLIAGQGVPDAESAERLRRVVSSGDAIAARITALVDSLAADLISVQRNSRYVLEVESTFPSPAVYHSTDIEI